MKYIKSTTSHILIVFLLWSINHAAQDNKIIRQTLSSSGSSNITSINGQSIFVQQSIGQASAIGTYHTSKKSLRQGFIQPLKKAGKLGDKDPIIVTVYPNPCTDMVQVDFEEQYSNDINLQVFDVTGKLIASETHNDQKKISIDTSNFSSGIYFLKILINNQSITKKISKS